MSENILKNENGSVIIIAVVMLVLITIMGLSVTRLSDVDTQIAKNEREYVESFYVADSAWREAVQWLDTRAQVPALVNKELFLAGEPGDYRDEHILNVRNYGDGEDGSYNVNTTTNYPNGAADGILGTGNSAAGYWYKVAYLNEEAMAGEKAPSFGENFRNYAFTITSIANKQRVDVTVKKVLKTGE